MAELSRWLGQGAVIEGREGGERRLTAYRRVPGTEWLVRVSQDLAAAFVVLSRIGVGAVILVSVSVLLTLLLAQLVSGGVLRRLRTVRTAADALARGEWERRAVPAGGDELEGLARAFNHMAEQVQSAHHAQNRTNGELRDAVQARDDFVSMASHELRTPLTPLKASAQTMKRMLAQGAPDRAQFVRMLDRIERQAERLARLVEDMLDTSRIQSSRFSLKPERMELSALVDEVVDRFRLTRGPEGTRLRFEAPGEPVEGTWDSARVEQVVVNLVENAFRYSPCGGEILVRLHPGPQTVTLSVADRGIGIPPANLSQLFEPFFRAGNAAARHFGGLGLGLHICREIALRHGGRIWAQSEGPERGSTFFVELPRVCAGAQGDGPAEAEAEEEPRRASA